METDTLGWTLPDGLELGPVTLRVADLGRAVAFYETVLGARRLTRDRATAVLGGADDRPLLALRETPGARPQPRHAAGLYHVAVLVPSRAALGHTLERLLQAGVRIGQADHLVSEALYLSDPDGNGLEIYRDRPRDQWPHAQGQLQMAVDPLDLQALREDGRRSPRPEGETGLPAGTRIGHVHLQVGDLAQAEQFYRDILGLALMLRFGDAASFLSAGGYHHHLGLNTWQSRGAAPTPPGTAGLDSFTLTVPTEDDTATVRARVGAAGLPARDIPGGFAVTDPAGVALHIVRSGILSTKG